MDRDDLANDGTEETGMTATSEPGSSSGALEDVPAAVRSRRSGWRSPRLAIGVVLVAGCVVLGARTFAAADETVPVWAVVTELPAGALIGTEDLERRQLRFPDDATAAAYVSASTPVEPGSRVNRGVGAGELLPRAAVEVGAAEALVEVPLSVASDDLPSTVRQGSTVDVWVTADPASGAAGAATSGASPVARKVLEEVEVVAVPGGGEGLAPQQTRQVILGLPRERGEELGAALGAWAGGRVVVARVG